MKEQVIAIFGVPRTGTSWLGEIFNSVPHVIYKYQPLFSYAFKDRISVRSSEEEINQFFDELLQVDDEFLDQIQMRENKFFPTFNKAEGKKTLVFKEVRYLYLIPHLLQMIERIKIVMILREPISTLESWINAPSEWKKEWKLEEEWYFAQSKNEYKPENYYGYAKWKEAKMLFESMHRQYPNNTYLLDYDELRQNTETQIKNAFSFCNLEYTKQTAQFIYDSKNKTVDNSYGVYRKFGEDKLHHCQLPNQLKEYVRQDLLFMKKINMME